MQKHSSLIVFNNMPIDYSMMLLTTPEPTVRPPSREFSRVFSHVFNVFSGFLYTKSGAFLYIIHIIQSSWHRFGTDRQKFYMNNF